MSMIIRLKIFFSYYSCELTVVGFAVAECPTHTHFFGISVILIQLRRKDNVYLAWELVLFRVCMCVCVYLSQKNVVKWRHQNEKGTSCTLRPITVCLWTTRYSMSSFLHWKRNNTSLIDFANDYEFDLLLCSLAIHLVHTRVSDRIENRRRLEDVSYSV